eukprot:gene31085-30102_t
MRAAQGGGERVYARDECAGWDDFEAASGGAAIPADITALLPRGGAEFDGDGSAMVRTASRIPTRRRTQDDTELLKSQIAEAFKKIDDPSPRSSNPNNLPSEFADARGRNVRIAFRGSGRPGGNRGGSVQHDPVWTIDTPMAGKGDG